MKLPDPVAWWNGKETAWFEHELDGYKPPPGATIPLFTEAQLREALAQQEAVMRMALELLGPQAPECCGCAAEWNEAIKLLEEQLK